VALASPEKDRAVALHLRRAAGAVEQALREVKSCEGYRAKRVERDLSRILHAMSEVGSVVPKFGGGGDDPDLLSEEERSLRARKAREERRLLKQAASTEGDG
jgi:hypothetical protein